MPSAGAARTSRYTSVCPRGHRYHPPDGCVLGIDVGSTSTDLVLTGRDGTLIDYQYLRTAGDPEGAVRRGLDVIHDALAGVLPGSGRHRLRPGAHWPPHRGRRRAG